ncbi:putative phage protein gp47/JayE [Lachnotalea glycerini]|uniref:Putative phage protein gp47/JayE n=1 Tax=Lachnotalea glycerini TaxID=1763509 RepID=A0A318EM37_9FIRM|nr:baseplate J/gp47 family protein [Lachnotalea glycerini]PXV85082.1 putative phage protein gp47/JayE [Lachnotalea glycerini]
MFEDKDYESLLDEKLSKVDSKYDKREGSIIYDALAPNSAEAAMIYIQLEWMFKQMFGDTADREYLIKIAKDTRGLEPNKATYAILKGEFNIAVDIGTRFSLDTLNYAVTELIDDSLHTYKVQCEKAGVEGNKHFGTMIPINYISGLTRCELTGLLIPGEEEEGTEVFRKRWRDAFNATAFGGNRADYTEKIKAIAGVGGCKCYRATNESGELVGGHVKCVIIASDYSVPTKELVNTVQQVIDPTQDMEGYGLAPIGHVAHIQSVTGTVINIVSTITYDAGIAFVDIKTQIESVVDNYFLSLAKAWETSSNLVARISQIESAILNVDGVQDIADTKLNGVASNVILSVDAIPVRGEISG